MSIQILPRAEARHHYVARFFEDGGMECRYLYLTGFEYEHEPVLWVSNGFHKAYAPDAQVRGVGTMFVEDGGVLTADLKLYTEAAGLGEASYFNLDLTHELVRVGFLDDNRFMGERLVEPGATAWANSYSEWEALYIKPHSVLAVGDHLLGLGRAAGRFNRMESLNLKNAVSSPQEIAQAWDCLRRLPVRNVVDDSKDGPF